MKFKFFLVSIFLIPTTIFARYAIPEKDKGIIGKIKKHRIEGRLNPINVYEVCLDGIVYLLLVDGYKAGMTVKIQLNSDGTTNYAKCKRFGKRWEQVP